MNNRMKHKNRQRFREGLVKLLMTLLFIAGIATFSYPFVADKVNAFLDQRLIAQHQKDMHHANEQERKKQLQQLKEANEQRYSGMYIPEEGKNMLDPFTELKENVSERKSQQFYQKNMLGSVHIPKISVSLPVFKQANDTFLDKGAAVWSGASQPTGGNNTHAVITGHSGLPNKKLFTDLEKLKIGDHVYLEILGEKLAYEIETISVVLPTELDKLSIQEGRDLLTLLTCTPYAVNTHRLLVTGYRIPYEAPMDQKIKQTKKQTQQLLIWLAGAAGLAISSIGLYFWKKRRKSKRFA